MKDLVIRLCLVMFVSVGFLHTARAALIDEWRVLFVTQGTLHPRIPGLGEDYVNEFVATEAAKAHPVLQGTSWMALAATPYRYDALASTGLSLYDTSTRFFNFRGEIIAVGVYGGLNSLYDGVHLAPITDQFGNVPETCQLVATGTTNGGSARYPLGDPNEYLTVGVAGPCAELDSGSWTEHSEYIGTERLSLYGVSEPFSIPEPSNSKLIAFGAVGLILFTKTRAVGNV